MANPRAVDDRNRTGGAGAAEQAAQRIDYLAVEAANRPNDDAVFVRGDTDHRFGRTVLAQSHGPTPPVALLTTGHLHRSS